MTNSGTSRYYLIRINNTETWRYQRSGGVANNNIIIICIQVKHVSGLYSSEIVVFISHATSNGQMYL